MRIRTGSGSEFGFAPPNNLKTKSALHSAKTCFSFGLHLNFGRKNAPIFSEDLFCFSLLWSFLCFSLLASFLLFFALVFADINKVKLYTGRSGSDPDLFLLVLNRFQISKLVDPATFDLLFMNNWIYSALDKRAFWLAGVCFVTIVLKRKRQYCPPCPSR